MGCRRRYYYTPRTVACLGTPARSTKDQARPASDGIPQGMILQAPLNDCVLKFYSSWSLGNTGLNPINNTNLLQMDLAGVVRVTLCKRILLQVRHIRLKRLELSWDKANGTAYNIDHVPPPVYQPPDNGSKINPHQDWAAVPPPGPPPGHQAGESSRTMETVPLNEDMSRQDNTSVQPHIETETPKRLSRLNPFK